MKCGTTASHEHHEQQRKDSPRSQCRFFVCSYFIQTYFTHKKTNSLGEPWMVSCLAQMLGKFLVALLLAQLQANQSNGVIRGQILIPSVRAAERVPVTIQRSDGPIVARLFTDALGNYEARNLPVGNYDVVVNIEGYEEVRQQVGVGSGTFNAVTVNIPLREKESIVIRRDGPSDDVVDVTRAHPQLPAKGCPGLLRRLARNFARETTRKPLNYFLPS
jgi:transglutaminase-like putative cysteine protease